MAKNYKHRKDFTFEGKRYSVRADDPVELGRKLEAKMRELESHRNIVSGDMLLRDWAEQCVETYKAHQADTTRKAYVQVMNHCILEHIGDMPLKKIRPLHCQEALNLQQGNSNRQINGVYQTMRFLFKYAVANHLIASDPTEFLIKPKGKPVQSRRALTPYERKMIIQVAETKRKYYAYLLMLYCGCRPVEAYRCMGKDIQQVDDSPVLHIRGTKTENADRYVPIPDDLYPIIKDTPPFEYIAQRDDGSKLPDKPHLWRGFKHDLNVAMGVQTYRNKIVGAQYVAPDLYPYCLRHEFCTDLARRGVDIRVAQYLMGHSDISLTANIYTNLTKNDVADAIKALDDTATPAATMPLSVAK